jgi:hypothetical protein
MGVVVVVEVGGNVVVEVEVEVGVVVVDALVGATAEVVTDVVADRPAVGSASPWPGPPASARNTPVPMAATRAAPARSWSGRRGLAVGCRCRGVGIGRAARVGPAASTVPNLAAGSRLRAVAPAGSPR